MYLCSCIYVYIYVGQEIFCSDKLWIDEVGFQVAFDS